MKWVVVKFTETKDCSFINWLVENETEKLATCTVKFCKWPPLRTVTSDDLKRPVKPKVHGHIIKLKYLAVTKPMVRKKISYLIVNIFMSKHSIGKNMN